MKTDEKISKLMKDNYLNCSKKRDLMNNTGHDIFRKVSSSNNYVFIYNKQIYFVLRNFNIYK